MQFSYRGLSMDEIIRHLALFVSRLWQIHAFGEGNTRTTAVLFIKYLRTLGFDVTNDIFAENTWYFRNSLVRANYNDFTKGIHEMTEYLELLLRNLLLCEHNPLHNRKSHISRAFKETEKPDIQDGKSDIEFLKADIGNRFTAKTTEHIPPQGWYVRVSYRRHCPQKLWAKVETTFLFRCKKRTYPLAQPQNSITTKKTWQS